MNVDNPLSLNAIFLKIGAKADALTEKKKNIKIWTCVCKKKAYHVLLDQ